MKHFEKELDEIISIMGRMYLCPIKDDKADCAGCALRYEIKNYLGEVKEQCLFVDIQEAFDKGGLCGE